MDFVKSAVSFLTFRRFYRYLLNRVLGGVFIADFSVDNLDVELFKGEVQLTDVSINIVKLNSLLLKNSIPIVIESGHVSKLHVKIPWKSIFEDNCKMYLGEVYLKLCVSPGVVFISSSSSGFVSYGNLDSLSRLVTKVLMNSQGYIDRLVIDVHSSNFGDQFFRVKISNIAIISIFKCTVHKIVVDFVTSELSSQILLVVNTECELPNLSIEGVFVDIANFPILEKLHQTLKDFSSSTNFNQTNPNEKDTTNHPQTWYEEIYSLFEAEVVRVEEDADFVDAVEDRDEWQDVNGGNLKLETVCISQLQCVFLSDECVSWSVAFEKMHASYFPIPRVGIGGCVVSMLTKNTAEPLMYISTISSPPSWVTDRSFQSGISCSSDGNSEVLSDTDSSSVLSLSADDPHTIFFVENVHSVIAQWAPVVKPKQRAGGFVLIDLTQNCSFTQGDFFCEISDSHFVFFKKISANISPIVIVNVLALAKNLSVFASTANSETPQSNVEFKLGWEILINLQNGQNLVFCKGESISIFLKSAVGKRDFGAEIVNLATSVSSRQPVHHAAEDDSPVNENEWTTVVGGFRQKFGVKKHPPPVNVAPHIIPPTNAVPTQELNVTIQSIHIPDSPTVFYDLQMKLSSLMDQISVLQSSASEGAQMSVVASVCEVVVCSSIHLYNTRVNMDLGVNISGSVTIDELSVVGAVRSRTKPACSVTLAFKSGTNTIDTTFSGLIIDCIQHEILTKLVEFFSPPVNVPEAPLVGPEANPTFTMYTITLNDCVCTHTDAALWINDTTLSCGLLSTVDSKTPAGVSVKIGSVEVWLALNPGHVFVSRDTSVGFTCIGFFKGGVCVVQWTAGQGIIGSQFNIDLVRIDLKPKSFIKVGDLVEQFSGFLAQREDTVRACVPTHVPNLPYVQDTSLQFLIEENFVQSRVGRGGSRFASRGAPPKTDNGRWFIDPKRFRVVYDYYDGFSTKWQKSMKISRLDVNFFSGSSFLCVEVENMQWLHSEEKGQIGASRVGIRDGVVGSIFQNLLCSLADNSVLFTYDINANLKIPPLAVSIDQDTLDFIQKFVRDVVVLGYTSETDAHADTLFDESGTHADVPLGESNTHVDPGESNTHSNLVGTNAYVDPVYMNSNAEPVESNTHVDIRLGESNTLLGILPAETNLQVDKPVPVSHLHGEAHNTHVRFPQIRISEISVEFNYKSKRVSLSGLRRGDFVQMLNLLPLLEGLCVEFSAITLTDVADFKTFRDRILAHWLSEAGKSHILKTISSVRPIRSIRNITQSVNELFQTTRGISNFLRTFLAESLNLADVLVSSAQCTLEAVDNITGGNDEGVECVWLDNEDETEWTTIEPGAARKYRDPVSTIDGIRTGKDTFVRGLKEGLNVTKFSRAPRLVLKPAIGATQAVSMVLRGARSTMDLGKQRTEAERTFKGPHESAAPH